jgi:hypothetical protein
MAFSLLGLPKAKPKDTKLNETSKSLKPSDKLNPKTVDPVRKFSIIFYRSDLKAIFFSKFS